MDRGEPSRENESPDEEKPLKKARYTWEVKGKSHLAESSKQPGTSSEVAPTAEAENCCHDELSDESTSYPSLNDLEDEIPVTLLVAPRVQGPRDQDYYLRKWHARQMARGFVDNTINSMLEHWIDRGFDPATLVDDSENDGQVEDDAILMAIQSHGLQSGPTMRSSTDPMTLVSSIFSSNSNSSAGSNVAVAGSIRSESRNEGLNNNQEPAVDNLENLQKENELLGGSSSSSMSAETGSSTSNPFGELDFLNAAVSVAIQKKGLTYG